MKNSLLFSDKTTLDEAVSDIPFETKSVALETETDTHWYSTFDLTHSHSFVDLGLPSGILWADKNIGANNPYDAGFYFQWGDVQGYTAEQVGNGEGLKSFSGDYSDYKFYDGTGFTKYNNTDGKTVLELEDDGTREIYGRYWRIPTTDDFIELANNTDIFLIPTEGEEISGTVQSSDTTPLYIKFQATVASISWLNFYKADDHSVSLFIPAFGWVNNGSVQNRGLVGCLWTASVYSLDEHKAYNFGFNGSVGDGSLVSADLFNGFPLRGVVDKQPIV